MIPQKSVEPGLDTECILRSLIAEFGSSPLANGRRMRELVQINADEFRRSAVALLRETSDRRGYRYLLTLLWTHDLLLPLLSDETLPIHQALEAAQVAAEIDPQLHIRITRYLIANTLEQQTINETQATKLLEVLAAINDSVSLQPFVRQMLLHPSPRIRSKLSVLIGKSHSGNRSLSVLLADPDPRVRANAVEALWNNSSPEISALVRSALNDQNNRVVGNAIVGLYLAADNLSAIAAVRLTAHPEPLFRATAAWAMGQTRDPRFLPWLGRMLADSTGTVRKTVFGSIALIKKAGAARAANPPLRVAILEVATLPEGKTRVKAVAVSAGAPQVVDVPVTGFVLESSGTPVLEYACSSSCSERVLLTLAIPRSSDLGDERRAQIEQGVLSSLHAKRVADQWLIAKYSNSDANGRFGATLFGQTLNASASTPTAATSAYSSNPIALTRALESKSTRYDAEPSLLSCLRTALGTTPTVNGSRHVIVVVPNPDLIEKATLEELIHAAQVKRTSIHALCFRPAPDFVTLCAGTQGFCRDSVTYESFRDDMETFTAALEKLYTLEFSGCGDTSDLALSVYLPTASGRGFWGSAAAQPQQHLEVA